MPWFNDGLKFSCTQCGKCCQGEGWVFIEPGDVRRLAEYLEIAPKDFMDRYVRVVNLMYGPRLALRDTPSLDCVFYDRELGCTVHEAKPTQCRTYPFWHSHTRTPEAWQSLCEDCPGAGTGELHAEERIVELVNLVKR